MLVFLDWQSKKKQKKTIVIFEVTSNFSKGKFCAKFKIFKFGTKNTYLGISGL